MRFVIGVILLLIGLGCVVVGAIWQQILCYEMFGAIFEKVFIPHWSALFYLGAIPMVVGSLMSGIEIN
jgi:hypothetical protein